MSCTEMVSKLINRPVVSLFDTRVSGTSGKMVAQTVYPKRPTTTNHNKFKFKVPKGMGMKKDVLGDGP
jgi:hypothetical protein